MTLERASTAIPLYYRSVLTEALVSVQSKEMSLDDCRLGAESPYDYCKGMPLNSLNIEVMK